MQLRVEFQFNPAHRLPLYEGPCYHTHGHNYQLFVLVESKVNPDTGLSMDFGHIKKIVYERALDRIDHDDLNRVLDNPTAESPQKIRSTSREIGALFQKKVTAVMINVPRVDTSISLRVSSHGDSPRRGA